jgi:choline dehydrogenase-like flavoprotein
MDITYVPDAIHRGARVLTSVQVRAVETEGRRARAVLGRVVAPFTGAPGPRFRVNAKLVVLAAGCMATPVILQKSGNLANRSKQVGENLQFHPGAAIMGIFSEPTHPQFGATQSYQSLDLLREGLKLETLWAPPALLAVRMPGLGQGLKRRLAEIRHAAVWDALVSCHRSLGRVRARRRSMDPILSWEFHPQDVKTLARGFWVLAELFFAAGARKILPGVYGVPEEIHSLEEAEVFRNREHKATDFSVGSNHAFCSTRMHGDPTKGVVDEDGKCHDLENLYIADTGIFPRCTSVNPMFTGMALAHRIAGRIADRI